VPSSWYSPFLIDDKIIKNLSSFGYDKIDDFSSINDKTIVIFDTPHEFISKYLKSNLRGEFVQLLHKFLLEIKELSKTNLYISLFELSSLSKESLNDFVKEKQLKGDLKYQEIDPISSLICLNLFQKNQETLNLYLDIELNYFKVIHPHETYINRLQKAILNYNPVNYLKDSKISLEKQNISFDNLNQKLKVSDINEKINEAKKNQLLIENEKLLKDYYDLEMKITSLKLEKKELLINYDSTLKLIKYQKNLTRKGLMLIKKLLNSTPTNSKKLPNLISDLTENNFYN